MSNSMSGAASLEAEMEICQDAARKAIARGDAIDPAQDEYGHARSAAHADALRYMKMSARLGLSLAKLKGEHTLRIHKTETVKPPPSVERPPGRLAAPSPDRFQEAWKKFTREQFGWDWESDDDSNETTGEGDPLQFLEVRIPPRPDILPTREVAPPSKRRRARPPKPTGRRRGGQPGNRNRWRHGAFSRSARESRTAIDADLARMAFVEAQVIAHHACELRHAAGEPAIHQTPPRPGPSATSRRRAEPSLSSRQARVARASRDPFRRLADRFRFSLRSPGMRLLDCRSAWRTSPPPRAAPEDSESHCHTGPPLRLSVPISVMGGFKPPIQRLASAEWVGGSKTPMADARGQKTPSALLAKSTISHNITYTKNILMPTATPLALRRPGMVSCENRKRTPPNGAPPSSLWVCARSARMSPRMGYQSHMTDPKPGRDVAALVAIMRRLRDPDGGCPWDLEQTFQTIAPYTIEEAYEVSAAIEAQDWPGLKDELGDLLLQVVYHSRIAEERGLFALGDVVEAITSKMIRRHPHVFGSAAAEHDSHTQKDTWETLKAGERKAKGEAGTLDGVPLALPALTRAEKLQRRLSSVGFDWNSPKLVLDKVAEEAAEIVEAQANGASHAELEGEIGDLLFVIANLARHLKVDPEAALRTTNSKVTRRFGWIETELAKTSRGPKDATLEEMEALWQQAKTQA